MIKIHPQQEEYRMDKNINHNDKDFVKVVKDHFITLKEIYQKEDLSQIQKRVENLVKEKIEFAQTYWKENIGIESVEDAKKILKKAQKKMKNQVKNKFKLAKQNDVIHEIKIVSEDLKKEA